MKLRTPLVLVAMALVAGLAFAQQKSGKAERAIDFQPAQILAATAEPQYPHNSIAQGSVILELTIGPAGDLEKIHVLSPLPSLTEEAEKTVRKWTYRGATLDNRPVRSTLVVSFTFRTIIPPIR